MKTVVRVVGARPQYMQVPILRQRLIEQGVKHILIHTGQHYDPIMAGELARELGLGEPDINLKVGSASHANQTAQIMSRLEAALLEVKPDFVIVDGDTNSTLATALVTSKLRIPLLHVEAGIRDFDRDRPEEINRILTDHACELNAAPIPRALDNLRHEGLIEKSELTGDLLLDNFIRYESKIDSSVFKALDLKERRYNLITLHRPENTDQSRLSRFEEILSFIAKQEKQSVFPFHPRIAGMVADLENDAAYKNIRFIPAVSYLQMLALVRGADTVFTDSGGLSREAVWSGAKAMMFFKVDTWHDFLERGWAQIAKGDHATMEQALSRLTPAPPMASQALFGGGRGSERIVQLLRTKGWI
jgi:UDP-N-acetylglucosamine 2-epimerase